MQRPIGFSTGALAFGDFRRALRMLAPLRLPVVELSALRDTELAPLLASLDSLDLSPYSYVSIHAPSSFKTLSERDASELLRRLLPRRWPVVVHPDVLGGDGCWEGFGEWLCVENMDKRKPIGRTAEELKEVFDRFPRASLCFDIGHARQVDPTMGQAALILRRFGNRLKQVHISEVNSRSQHDAISFTALNSFRKIAHLIPPATPIVLETIVAEEEIWPQVALAAESLSSRPQPVA